MVPGAASKAPHFHLLENPPALQTHIQSALQTVANPHPVWDDDNPIDDGLSVVLFLLGLHSPSPGHVPVPCLILNKRSIKVRQPGDLCCPGGGVEPRFDRLAAHLMRLPLSPLKRWHFYRFWQTHTPHRLPRLRMLLAAALREGMEEMRLNPFGVRFLGTLPPEKLVMFKRTIVPMVVWAPQQRRFWPNWEVERIIRIPISDLLAPSGYIGLRLQMASHDLPRGNENRGEFPAFRLDTTGRAEILWGATYRITMQFLARVFGFEPPQSAKERVVEKRLTADYLTGKG